MGYVALYRKFRPTRFDEIVGQEHIVQTLKNQIINKRIGHAFLFSGGRGSGKTSTAKVLSRAVNCLSPIDGEPCNECEICKEALAGTLTDIKEMDAASNNGVDNIRDIREEVEFMPTKAKYRVYIIDEVHMLSTGAFNALLKTLEEPPAHIIFILATTEPQKLPATILSRCQRFDFKRISPQNIIKRLRHICEEANIKIEEDALRIIATLSEGAMRDAISILDRCITDGDTIITESKIKELAGVPEFEYLADMLESILTMQPEKVLKNTETIINLGKNINVFLWELIKLVRDALVYKTCGELEMYNQNEKERLFEIIQGTTKERLINLINELSEIETRIKWSNEQEIMFETGLIKICMNNNQEEVKVKKEETTKVETTKKEETKKAEKIKKEEEPKKEEKTEESKSETSNIIEETKEVKEEQKKEQVEEAKPSEEIKKEEPKEEVAHEEKAEKIEEKEMGQEKPTTLELEDLLQKLRERGKVMVATYLLNTKLEEINDLTVGIIFDKVANSLTKSVLEKEENKKAIRECLSEILKREVDIKFIEEKPEEKATIPPINFPINIIE